MSDFNPWKCPNCRTVNASNSTICSGCGKEKGTYVPETSKAKVSQKHNCFKVTGYSGECLAATLLYGCAAVIWIAGIICTIMTIPQNLLLGLGILAGFGVVGLIPVCTAELFQNVADIAATLQNMTITQTEYRED